MAYLLDTNIFICALKGQPRVQARLERTAAVDVLLSPVVLGELELGVEKSAHVERNRERLARVVDGLAVVPLDAVTARCYARIRADLERTGTPIGANDLWIAAQALALGAVLVTDKEREFSRVGKLTVENWLAEGV
jgi:tRNA(fMet)-specific endonuclease VapC